MPRPLSHARIWAAIAALAARHGMSAGSYTHLTLPTDYAV